MIITYVTYEGLFAFMQMIFSLITAITGVITLVIGIVKIICNKGSDKKRKK